MRADLRLTNADGNSTESGWGHNILWGVDALRRPNKKSDDGSEARQARSNSSKQQHFVDMAELAT
jgi:hypothetical protein